MLLKDCHNVICILFNNCAEMQVERNIICTLFVTACSEITDQDACRYFIPSYSLSKMDCSIYLLEGKFMMFFNNFSSSARPYHVNYLATLHSRCAA